MTHWAIRGVMVRGSKQAGHSGTGRLRGFWSTLLPPISWRKTFASSEDIFISCLSLASFCELLNTGSSLSVQSFEILQNISSLSSTVSFFQDRQKKWSMISSTSLLVKHLSHFVAKKPSKETRAGARLQFLLEHQ